LQLCRGHILSSGGGGAAGTVAITPLGDAPCRRCRRCACDKKVKKVKSENGLKNMKSTINGWTKWLTLMVEPFG
jgi:hypothetical protein